MCLCMSELGKRGVIKEEEDINLRMSWGVWEELVRVGMM